MYTQQVGCYRSRSTRLNKLQKELMAQKTKENITLGTGILRVTARVSLCQTVCCCTCHRFHSFVEQKLRFYLIQDHNKCTSAADMYGSLFQTSKVLVLLWGSGFLDDSLAFKTQSTPSRIGLGCKPALELIQRKKVYLRVEIDSSILIIDLSTTSAFSSTSLLLLALYFLVSHSTVALAYSTCQKSNIKNVILMGTLMCLHNSLSPVFDQLVKAANICSYSGGRRRCHLLVIKRQP